MRQTSDGMRGGALMLAVLLAYPVQAQSSGLGTLPEPVTRIVACDRTGDASQVPFAGKMIFDIGCPGNHQNSMRALVLADGPDGRSARLLRFKGADGSTSEATEISNVRLFAKTGSIGTIYVDTEARRGQPCRFEAQYRLTAAGVPQRIFARHNKSCDDSPRGWTLVLDRRTSAEKMEDWR